MKDARQAAQKEALDELFKHDVGCTCAFCDSVRTRFPVAPADNADEFAKAGGEHQAYPFDAENTAHLASIAKSLGIVASAISGLRDVFRGRDAGNEVVQSPYRVLVDHLIGRKQAQPTGPAAQRTPAPTHTQAAPVATSQPAQAPLFGASAKRVATDQEMQQFVGNLAKFTPKVRFDKPYQWPKESQKGRVILTNGQGGLASEVDPDYLDIYADSIEYFANEAKKKISEGSTDAGHKRDAQYGELEAARYRRVAQMVRTGQIQRVAAAPTQAYSGGGDYE